MSTIWVTKDWVYKHQDEFYTDNEIYFYKVMYHTGYVPYAEQVDRSLIKTEFIPLEKITSTATFLSHLEPVLNCLEAVNIKHGDLTEYAIRIKDNKPFLIDFSESRFIDDPRPDKRHESDRYWLTKTMHKLAANSVNKRFPEQIAIVSDHVDFANKTVLDLGCGYGDMLLAAHNANAKSVTGIDKNLDVLKATRERTSDTGIRLIQNDINQLTLDKLRYDVAICFSVLPYLDDMNATLSWIRNHSNTALLEAQYKNDGKGTIKDDTQAESIFKRYWDKVTPIGKTLVDYREMLRTIWLCENV